MGIGYNEDTDTAGVMIQGKMMQLRSGADDFYDSIIILINNKGYATKAVSFTQGES